MTDDNIVELFIKRDENAIKGCIEKYGKSLRIIANTILQDIDAAMECENDTYLRAWNVIPPNEPRTYLFAFLARITRHAAIDQYRKKQSIKRNAELVELTAELEQCIDSHSNSVEDIVESEELAKAISNFLRTLSKTERQLFVRRYWYMDSIENVADDFGFTKSKVKTTLFRTRNKLAIYLKKEGYEV